MARPVVIHADWDPEAAVWVATTNDLKGLVTEADTIEALRAKLPGMILDLLEEYGVSDLPASIEIIARASNFSRLSTNVTCRTLAILRSSPTVRRAEQREYMRTSDWQ
jgi:predicted RNase H-like HicB family nuclease